LPHRTQDDNRHTIPKDPKPRRHLNDNQNQFDQFGHKYAIVEGPII
jgi:hypothetical protein